MTIWIDRDQGLVTIRCYHETFHEVPESPSTVPNEIRQYIADRSRYVNFSGICMEVWKRFPSTILRPTQIRHWWRQHTTSTYYRDVDEIVSAKKLILELADEGFEDIFFEDGEVSAFGFTSPFFATLVRNSSVKEWHIDSTFKTNRKGYELFGVVANCEGAGYGAAY